MSAVLGNWEPYNSIVTLSGVQPQNPQDPILNAVQNMNVLQQAIAEIQAMVLPNYNIPSGTLYIPNFGDVLFFLGGPAYIGATAALPSLNMSIKVIGTRGQRLNKQDNLDFFLVNVNGQNFGLGGVQFEDLFINNTSGQPTAGSAFNIIAGEEIYITNCFVDSMWSGITLSNVLHPVITNFNYYAQANYAPNSGNGIYVTGPGGHSCNQVYIYGFNYLGNNNNGTTGVGLNIENVDHLVLVTSSIQQCFNGIVLMPNAGTPSATIFQTYMFGFQIGSADVGLLLQTTPTGAWISDLKVFGCAIQGGNQTTASGIMLTLGRGSSTQTPNTQINSIFIFGAKSWNASAAGIELNTGSQIKCIGCQFSSNVKAGIWINGPVADAYFQGCDLTPVANTGKSGTVQPLALLIDNTLGAGVATKIVLRDCNMTGYSGNPVSVLAAPTVLKIFDCDGYNDQETTVQTVIPGSPALLGGPLGTTTPYYGPVLVQWIGGTIANVKAGFTQNPALMTPVLNVGGQYHLAPGEYMQITYSVAPTSFKMIGK